MYVRNSGIGGMFAVAKMGTTDVIKHSFRQECDKLQIMHNSACLILPAEFGSFAKIYTPGLA